MSSTAFFYSRPYAFYALADDEMSLQIDGTTYINTMGAGMSGKPVQVTIPTAQGNHNLVVQYRQYTGTAYVYLNWAYATSGAPPMYPPMCPFRRPSLPRRAIPRGLARVRRKRLPSRPNTATTRPVSSRLSSKRHASSQMDNGTPRIRDRSRLSRRSRCGAAAHPARSSACSSRATRRRWKRPAPRRERDGSTTARARR